MRCDDLSALIDLYIDNELPEETRSRLERHLMRCPHCAFEVRSLEQTRGLLRDAVPATEPSPAFRERLAARLADRFSDRLASSPSVSDRQWALPFVGEE